MRGFCINNWAMSAGMRNDFNEELGVPLQSLARNRAGCIIQDVIYHAI